MGTVFHPDQHIRNPPQKIAALSQRPEWPNLIVLPFQSGYDVVQLARIVRIEADGCYVTVHLEDNTQLYFAKTLKFFVRTLAESPNFVRIHRSHMINIQYLRTLQTKDKRVAELHDGTKIPISRRKFVDLKAFLKQWG